MELLVVVAIVIAVVASVGTFFLAGASPAVASAARDVTSVFAAARDKATASGRATVVFAANGPGFVARIYQDEPGTTDYAPASGLASTYDDVAIAETAAPLGAPGFAFVVSAHGRIDGLAHYQGNGTGATEVPCPASGAFTLTFTRFKQTAQVLVPCAPSANGSVTPASYVTPAPAISPTLSTPGPCTGPHCGPSLTTTTPSCPNGYVADPNRANTCDITMTVCNVVGNPNYDARAGSVSYTTNPPTLFVGTSAAPPCAPIRIQLPVCSSQPAGTDLGPDIDGVHEDVSSGVPCGGSSMTVCSIQGDPNYDARANTTVGGVQYVGSSTIPTPCAGIQVIVCSSPGNTNYDSRAGQTIGDFVYVGSTAVPSPCAPGSTPTPPPTTCPADAYGYCLLASSASTTGVCDEQIAAHIIPVDDVTSQFEIYNAANGQTLTFTHATHYHAQLQGGPVPQTVCLRDLDQWTPSEPSISLGDPNLP